MPHNHELFPSAKANVKDFDAQEYAALKIYINAEDTDLDNDNDPKTQRFRELDRMYIQRLLAEQKSSEPQRIHSRGPLRPKN